MTVGSHPPELVRPDDPLEVRHFEANEKLTQTSSRGMDVVRKRNSDTPDSHRKVPRKAPSTRRTLIANCVTGDS